MNLMRHHGGTVIVTSFVVALLLTIVPLPESLRIARPDWVTLTLIFWCLTLPDRISVTSGFMVDICAAPSRRCRSRKTRIAPATGVTEA